jgi:hypothetical protein
MPHMGWMNLFKGKPTSPSTVSQKPAADENQFAVELARRHHTERTANLQGESTEDVAALFARHAIELKSAADNQSGGDPMAFMMAFHTHAKALNEASTVEREARFAINYPEAAAAKKEGLAYVAAMARGEAVPSWIQELFDRGKAEGYERILVEDLKVSSQMISEQRKSFDDWLGANPNVQKWIARTVYQEGDEAGIQMAFSEKSASSIATAHAERTTVKLAAAASKIDPYLSDTAFWDHQVSTIHFLAGDLGKGNGYLLNSGKVRIPGGTKDFHMFAVATVEAASEESVKRVGGAIGWGLAGAALFGPAGFVVGGLLGGKGKDVTFVGTLKDGKRFMATAKSEVYMKFLAASFK